MSKARLVYEDLGRISYNKAWEYQKNIQQKVIKTKRETPHIPANRFILCEHDPVYTLGKSGDIGNLVYNQKALEEQGIEFYKTNRGGDITYHGPGQITGYPIFDLDQLYNDLHRYVREIEQVVINVLNHLGITSMRISGYTGVWLPKSDSNPYERKICAIGVHMSRWVSMHGFALNINTDLNHFRGIIPCGIQENNKGITSLQHELGRPVELDRIKQLLLSEFISVFGFELIEFVPANDEPLED